MGLKKRLVGALAAVGIITAPLLLSTPANAVETPINQCVGTWNIYVGGLGNNNSTGAVNVNQRVGYNSADTRGGVSELNRLVWDHSKACPGDRLRIMGHSGGAAVVNVWGKENGRFFVGKASLVLLADPKRPANWYNGPGFASSDFPFNLYPPLAGGNDNFQGLPRISVCRVNSDHICASRVGWEGYAGGRHNDYTFDMNAYPLFGNYVQDIHAW